MKYERYRSDIWITIHENGNDYNVSLPDKYTNIVDYFFPMLKSRSPKKWVKSVKYPGISNLWLPEGCYRKTTMEDFFDWCNEVTDTVLWLGLNRNIVDYYSEELDYCIASDFNRYIDDGRTDIGEAEYQLKYNSVVLTDEEKERYFNVLFDGLRHCCDYVPIGNKKNWMVSPLPCNEVSKSKLAWILARSISEYMRIPFLTPDLSYNKPQMKNLPITERISTWKSIYKDKAIDLSEHVSGKDIIIVDDLYQSGVSIWEYAKFLKQMGARIVFGIVCVKSLRDSDNT